MPDKSVKCACGKAFKTNAAMQQHKRDGGCTIKPKPQRKAARAANRQQRDAAVSKAVRVTESGTDSASVSGVDRLHHVADVRVFAHSSVVLDALVDASSFARLTRVAGAYQKVRYRQLRFRVVPMMSTAVGGGYVVAFVRDPMDQIPSEPLTRLNWLTSQRGSVTTKWWQSSEVVVPLSDRDYYTSTSQEVREYSPGRLVLAVDGKATASGSLTVFVDWAVTLRHASLESTLQSGRPDHVVVQRNLFTKDGNTYVWSYDPDKDDTRGSPDPEFMFSDWQVGDLFLLPSPMALEEYKSGTSGDAEVESYWVLHVESATGVRWRAHADTTDSGRAAGATTLIVPRGFILRRVEPRKASGEVRALQSLSLEQGSSELSKRTGGLFSQGATSSSSCLQRLGTCLESEPQSGTQQPGTVEISPSDLATLRGCLTELQPLLKFLKVASHIELQRSDPTSPYELVGTETPRHSD